jgi:3' terminal RNA ribose 2'-O-methyltransferase Hen1
MLLTVSTTHQPATDLGYLLHKNPSRVQTEELTFGKAHVFYPDADENLCTAALLVDVDPIGLVRGRGPAGEGGQLEQYVNDRPYAANSFLSVAMSRVFASALGGRSKDRPELADTPIPLQAHLPVLRARGGEDIVRRLFEPLGYTIEVQNTVLDEQFPEW